MNLPGRESRPSTRAPGGLELPAAGVWLIVNADDFGASLSVNQAVARGARHGILTSCSLMATGAAFDDAVRVARELEGFAIGLHLVTVLDRSVMGHRALPSITRRNGEFSSSPTLAGMRYFASARARRELERELAAQFEKVAGAGVILSHVDSHLHMHVNPAVFETALKLAREHGIRAMRLPREEPRAGLDSDGRRARPGASVQSFIFMLLCRRMARRLKEEGMIHADRIHGFTHSGRLTEEGVLNVLESLPSGVNELYLHPAAHAEGDPRDPAARQGRAEFRILVSERIRGAVESLGVRLTDYRQLAEAGEPCA